MENKNIYNDLWYFTLTFSAHMEKQAHLDGRYSEPGPYSNVTQTE